MSNFIVFENDFKHKHVNGPPMVQLAAHHQKNSKMSPCFALQVHHVSAFSPCPCFQMDHHPHGISSLPWHFQAIKTIIHQQDEEDMRHPYITGMRNLVPIHSITPSLSLSSPFVGTMT